MALQQRAQHVPPMVLTFVRLVPVNLTKMAAHALGALRVARVNTKQEHRVMAAESVIPKHVLKTNVCVPMALQQRAQIVLPMVRSFVRLVPVNLTKLATHALNALRAARVNTKQEHRVVVLEPVIPKRVRRAPVAVWVNI
jgi:hypothetical protein